MEILGTNIMHSGIASCFLDLGDALQYEVGLETYG